MTGYPGKKYVDNRFGMTSAGYVQALTAPGARLGFRYTIKPTLFKTADGRVCALTRDAIDRGLPQAAGIRIIDGDKPDPEQLADVPTVGQA